MKKMWKALALVMCSVFIWGGVTSCGGDDDDNGPSLTKIEVTAKPTQTDYVLGDNESVALDTTGAVVTATWSNGDAKDVTQEATFVPSSFSSEDLGESTKNSVDVKATYGGKESEAFAVTLYASETVKTTYENISGKKITIGTTVITIDANGNATDQDGVPVTISVDSDGKVKATLSDTTVYYATIDESGNTTVTDKDGNTVDATVEDNEDPENPAETPTNPATPVEEETPEVAPDPQTIVNATWDFKTNITGVADEAKFGTQAADTDLAEKGTNDLENTELGNKEIGAGLKILKASSDLKWKYEDDYDYGLYSGKKGDDTTAAGTYLTEYATAEYVKGKLELTLDDSAKVTLKVSGNGDEDPNYHRWVVVTNAAGKIVGSIDGLKKGEGNIVELKLNDGELVKAGTYTIWMNGSRLNAVTAKNGITENPDTIDVTSVTIDGGNATVALGGKKTFTATVAPANATDKTVTWSIATGATATGATINASTGEFSAGDVAGTASVVATAGGVPSAAVVVTVEEEVEEDTSVYTLTGESAEIVFDKDAVYDADAENASKLGYLTIVGGDKTWTGKSFGDDHTVTALEMKSDRSFALKVKGVKAFKVVAQTGTVADTRAYNVAITGGEGYVTKKYENIGFAKANTAEGQVFNTDSTDELTITISGVKDTVYIGYVVLYGKAQTIPATKVEITGKPDAALTLTEYAVDSTYNGLTATVTPAWHSDGAVVWSSETESVATIDSSTGVVTVKGEGTTKITAKVGDGENAVSDDFDLEIVGANVAVTGVSLSENSASIARIGTDTLTATISPDNATNKKVTWKSADESVASVTVGEDGTATVTGLYAGTTTITVTTADGNFSATCNVTVAAKALTIPETGLKLNLTTGGVDGYTVDGTNKGKWTKQDALLVESHDNIMTSTKIDGSGFYLHQKISTNGYVVFDLDKKCTLKISYKIKKNSNTGKYAGIAFTTADGAFEAVTGSAVQFTIGTSETENAPFGTNGSETVDKNAKIAYAKAEASTSSDTDYTASIALDAGSYKLYGAAGDTSAIASKLEFTTVSSGN